MINELNIFEVHGKFFLIFLLLLQVLHNYYYIDMYLHFDLSILQYDFILNIQLKYYVKIKLLKAFSLLL